jgi:tellurite resistance protein TerC
MVAPWVWAAAAAGLAAAIAAEVVLGRGAGRSGASGAGTARRAIGWVAVYVSLAVLFGLALGVTAGWVTAGQFYTGYLTEYSLSLDNLFVFSVIMTWFAVPPARQPRILLFGIGLAVIMRSGLIVAGVAALNHFGWLFYPLGVVLVLTAIGLIRGSGDGPDGEPERHARLAGWLRRYLQRSGRQGATPVLLLAAAIGLADLLFAFDSIPAVFGITTNALLVVACNVFALMGLRQLYVLLAGVLGRIAYLNAGLGLICAFIGVKLLLRALHDSGVSWAADIPAWLSVLVVAGVLLATVGVGLIEARRPHARLERTMLERRFAVVDTDGNGVWQWDDCRLLIQRLCQTFGHPADSAPGRAVATALGTLFDTMLSHLDANRDGAISREEFVAGVGPDLADRPGFDAAVGATARILIQVADADGNGVLDPGEYTRLAAVYGARADQAERAFGRLDQDRNGVLDATELTLAISQFFASRDPGGYGNVAFGHV